MGENGWAFAARDGSLSPGSTRDDLFGAHYLYEIYVRANPRFSGRVTVPVLWDTKRATIVNNESSELIRMLNSAFDAWGDASVDFYRQDLRGEIDRINALVYPNVNNGVYRCGFATTHAAYHKAFDSLFAALDDLDQPPAPRRHLAGSRMTDDKSRLFT